MTDNTYETESLHTPESRDRDARLVGHEVKTDTSKEAVDQLRKKLVFETVNSEIDKRLAGNIITMLRAIAAERDALEAENQRLREALTRIEDLTQHNMGMSAADETCVNREARAALKGDIND